jgi:cytochrome c oxidase subunit 1
MLRPATAEALPEPAPATPRRSYLTEETTVLSWLNTRDHKRVGLMYLAALVLALFLGGVFAMILRIELLTPDRTIIGPVAYNRLFTLHGVVMIFLFLVPAVPSAFGNFMVPLMIGARDVAFPRLNLLGFYLYLAGGLIVLVAMVHGGTDTGWTFYAPYSTTTPTAVVPVLFGIFVVGMSGIASGINFIVTIHTLRAAGLTWMRLPLFVWSIYSASIIQVIATPVLGLTLLLVAVEHAFHIGLFDASVGGDPVLMQHLFWFYAHPAVYITILPAMGVISEVVSGLARKNSFGYRPIVYSSLGIAFVGFFTWGHHLFVSGQSTFDAGFFGLASMLVGVFTAIKVFTWIGTMYKGAIAFTTPYAYVCGFIYFLVFGGMTGIALATVSLDAHWHDTYFIVAHFHFVMVGSALMGFLAGLHYWFPKMFGRAYPEGWGLVSTVLIIVGFNATFVPQFLLGNAGMPRRYYSYPAEFQALNVASTMGAFLLGLGFLIVLVYLVVSLRHGERVTGNPWDSRGFEWYTASPPPKENFDHLPAFTHAPHDYQADHPHGR